MFKVFLRHQRENGWPAPSLPFLVWVPRICNKKFRCDEAKEPSDLSNPTSERWLRCLLCKRLAAFNFESLHQVRRYVNDSDRESHSGTRDDMKGSIEHKCPAETALL